MKRRLIGTTLIIGLFTVFMFNGAYANWDGRLDAAKEHMENEKDYADTAYDTMRNTNILYRNWDKTAQDE